MYYLCQVHLSVEHLVTHVFLVFKINEYFDQPIPWPCIPNIGGTPKPRQVIGGQILSPPQNHTHVTFSQGYHQKIRQSNQVGDKKILRKKIFHV